MIPVVIAVILLAQDPTPAPVVAAQEPASRYFATPRIGIWWTGSFEASTTAGLRKIEQETLWDVGFDIGRTWDPWQVTVSIDFGATSDVQAFLGGINLGKRFVLEESADSPIEAVWSLGLIGGSYAVKVSDFGDFSAGFGFQSRIAVTVATVEGSGVDLWLELRYIPFEYADGVTDGNDSAVNASLAVGLSFVLEL